MARRRQRVEPLCLSERVQPSGNLGDEALFPQLVPVDFVHGTARSADAGECAARLVGALLVTRRIVVPENIFDLKADVFLTTFVAQEKCPSRRHRPGSALRWECLRQPSTYERHIPCRWPSYFGTTQPITTRRRVRYIGIAACERQIQRSVVRLRDRVVTSEISVTPSSRSAREAGSGTSCGSAHRKSSITDNVNSPPGLSVGPSAVLPLVIRTRPMRSPASNSTPKKDKLPFDVVPAGTLKLPSEAPN